MTKPLLRPAHASEEAFMRDCAKQAYEKYIPRIGKRPAPMMTDFGAATASDQASILEQDGHAVGYAVAYLKRDAFFVENIAILPGAQGTGLGRFMMAALEAQARSKGARAIELYTNAAMHENLDFYASLGFEQTDRQVQDGFDRVFFRKEL
ncbi:MAG: GNAT family N-acetyltransferase [Pseudomonadota bacterium]